MGRRNRKQSVNKVAAPSVRKQNADAIKMSVARYYAKKGWGVNFELGVSSRGQLRADVFCMAFKGYVVIVEVKSCVADFRTDSKWEGYLPFCNQFYFAFDSDTWAKLLKKGVEFGPEVGVIVIEAGKTSVKFAKRSKKRDLPADTLLNLALRAAYRGARYRSLTDIRDGGNKR